MQALESERMREELFLDFMKEHDRKLREERKAEEKKQAAAFLQLLEASVFIKASPMHPSLAVTGQQPGAALCSSLALGGLQEASVYISASPCT